INKRVEIRLAGCGALAAWRRQRHIPARKGSLPIRQLLAVLEEDESHHKKVSTAKHRHVSLEDTREYLQNLCRLQSEIASAPVPLAIARHLSNRPCLAR